ncbi:hypothetical protein [Cellulomonas marina]|uniref:Uncharacterized protein n=1 Tax=Cellulomonas marina TaxID=988821 RepID=A0A1I0ZSH8_9CELL|nr:hypothetical protein [Cellulomonas marina]GIG28808.1 hypothetical protein Cma02nite_14080 [Cellulomonas marina]SFB28322.1 hypothetical protein SAMN05421867_11287 [Cellulomonas marina]
MRDVLDVADRIAATSSAQDGADDRTAADGTDLRERLAAHVEAARTRRADLARKLAMADEFIGLLTAL